MRRVLHTIASGLLLIGLALWFFGGPNLGRSEWSREVRHESATGEVRVEQQQVFRPGLEFLGGMALVSLVLWGFAHRFPKEPARSDA
jgi:hypothetical protein